MDRVVEAVSRSLEDTAALGALLAAQLEQDEAVCLDGDLGAGKTTFVAALVKALGGDEMAVSSPTFTLENRYPPPAGPFTEVVHADLYRMDGGLDEGLVLSLMEAREMGALVVVEWARPVTGILRPCWVVQIRLDRGEWAAPADEVPRVFALAHSDHAVEETLAAKWRRVGVAG